MDTFTINQKRLSKPRLHQDQVNDLAFQAVPQDIPARQAVQQGLAVLKDRLVHRGPAAHKGQEVHKDRDIPHQDQEEGILVVDLELQVDHKDRLAHKDLVVDIRAVDLKGLLVHRDQVVHKGQVDHRDRAVRKVQGILQQDPEEDILPVVLRVQVDHKVLSAHKELDHNVPAVDIRAVDREDRKVHNNPVVAIRVVDREDRKVNNDPVVDIRAVDQEDHKVLKDLVDLFQVVELITQEAVTHLLVDRKDQHFQLQVHQEANLQYQVTILFQ